VSREWWREAVFYEIYVRSFADSNGDGIGDVPGITARLPYLRNLGIDAIWLTPFYPSPGVDHGYDVSNYVDVDPQFGTLADFDELVTSAHELGIRLIVDIVPNHTSDQHSWFTGDRSRYVTAPAADGLPNNWPSTWGGPAATVSASPWRGHEPRSMPAISTRRCATRGRPAPSGACRAGLCRPQPGANSAVEPACSRIPATKSSSGVEQT